MNSKYLKNDKINSTLKILVSGALIWFLIRKIGLQQITLIIDKTKIEFIIIAMILFFIGILFQVARLKILLNASDLSLPYGKLLEMYLISIFFGIFLPTVVGGDVVKAVLIASEKKNGSSVAAVVLADRVVGVISLFIVGLFATIFGFSYLNSDWRFYLLFIFASGFFFIFILFYEKGWRKLISLLERYLPSRLIKVLIEFQQTFHGIKKQKKSLAKALAISFVFYIPLIFTTYFVALALGGTYHVIYFFIFVPVIALAGMFPVSLGGLGVREGASVLFFSLLGAEQGFGFLLSFIPFVIKALYGLIGGLLYIGISLQGKPKPKENPETN